MASWFSRFFGEKPSPVVAPAAVRRNSVHLGPIRGISAAVPAATGVLVQLDPPGPVVALKNELIRLGSGEDCQVRISDPEVAAHHASIFYRDGGYVFREAAADSDTFIDEERLGASSEHRVTSWKLSAGEEIRIGSRHVFRFLLGGAESYLAERARRDPLTGALNKEYFLERLDKGFANARQFRTPLSVMAFELDRLQELNQAWGQAFGDRLLRRMAFTLSPNAPGTLWLGRIGGATFAFGLQGSTCTQAATFAQGERERVRAIAIRPGVDAAEDLRLDLSGGVVELQDRHASAASLLDDAMALLWAARKRGGGALFTGEPSGAPSQAPVPAMPGPEFVTEALARGEKGLLLAFEVGDERNYLELLGRRAYGSAVLELHGTVEAIAQSGNRLGLHRDRYVLTCVYDEAARERMVDRVREAWRALPIEGAGAGRLTRSIRQSAMPMGEVGEDPERSLDRLAARMLAAAGHRDTSNGLPFPIACHEAQLLTEGQASRRVRIVADGLEGGLRFLVGIEMAFLRETAADAELDSLARTVGEVADRPLGYGDWQRLAVALAKRVGVAGEASPVRDSARALLGDEGEPTELAKRLESSVERRNKLFGHGRPQAEDLDRSQEDEWTRLLRDWAAAMAPLRRARLVSLESIESVDGEDGEGIRYSLRQHQGPYEHFPLMSVVLPSRLTREWCYLLLDDRPPLCLSPVVSAKVCETCGRTEVFLAEGLVVGPKGRTVQMRGVSSNHRTEATLHLTEAASRLERLVSPLKR